MPRRPRQTAGQLIVSRYQQARARTRETEQRELSPKEFLDLIDPSGKRSDASAARYMRKLATGERSGARLKAHAEADSGKTVNVTFNLGNVVDRATGEVFPDVRSVNVILPEGRSRLDLWQGDRLRKAINKSLANSYMRRTEAYGKEQRERYTPVRRLPKGARLERIRRVTHWRHPAEIVR